MHLVHITLSGMHLGQIQLWCLRSLLSPGGQVFKPEDDTINGRVFSSHRKTIEIGQNALQESRIRDHSQCSNNLQDISFQPQVASPVQLACSRTDVPAVSACRYSKEGQSCSGLFTAFIRYTLSYSTPSDRTVHLFLY